MFDKRLMEICPESKKFIFGNIVFQWLELGMNAVMIAIVARVVEQLYLGRVSMQGVLPWVGLLLGTILVRIFTAYYANKMSYLASKTVKRVMREHIYQKLLRLGTSYREHASTAELVQESVEGVEQLESYFGQYVPQFFYAFLAPITLFFLFGVAGSFRVAIVLLICVPLIPGAIMMVQKIAKKLLSKYWDQYARLGSTFLENLQGMTTLKIYQADAYKNEQMNKESEHFRFVTMKVLTMQLNSIIIMDLVAYGGAALGIALAGKAFADGKLALSSCLFMILLSADFFLPMRRLGSYFHVAMNGMAASDKIFRFLGEPEPAEKKGFLFRDGGEICLNHISFSYNEEREILRDITMRVPKRSFVGIVGESGSGKSTIASLIMGRNTVREGSVTIAGMDLKEVSEESLLRTVTYVGLDSVFFKGTVRENLLLADPTATDEKLWEYLERCSLAEFFQKEAGLDTLLAENAGNLSGGQKQRLALTRALLWDSPIYIFDESTSNIDMESEEIILEQIRKLTQSKTIIMITHRLANVTDADCIYCLDAGSLVGSGRHEELLESSERYASLWRTQRELEQFGEEDRA